MTNRFRNLVAYATYLTVYAVVRFALHTSETVLLAYVDPISEDLADNRWHTFDEICALGHPEDIVRELMPLACCGRAGLHRYFEARLRSDAPVSRPPTTFDLSNGMSPDNAHLYEFRLIPDVGSPQELPDPTLVSAYA